MHSGSSTTGSVVWPVQALAATSATTSSSNDHHDENLRDRLTFPSSFSVGEGARCAPSDSATRERDLDSRWRELGHWGGGQGGQGGQADRTDRTDG
jgi:hypothetical protein